MILCSPQIHRWHSPRVLGLGVCSCLSSASLYWLSFVLPDEDRGACHVAGSTTCAEPGENWPKPETAFTIRHDGSECQSKAASLPSHVGENRQCLNLRAALLLYRCALMGGSPCMSRAWAHESNRIQNADLSGI